MASIPDNQAAPGAAQPDSRVAVARNAVHLVLGQVATTVLAILLSAALGRTLGAAEFGTYFLLLTAAQFTFVLVEWGQSLFVVREVARNPASTGSLVGTALGLRALGTACLAGPVGLATWLLGYGAASAWMAVAFVLATLPLSLAQGLGMAFRAHDRMGLEAGVSVANKVVLLAATVGALQLGLGLPGVIGAQALAGIVALGLAHRLYRGLWSARLEASRPAAVRILQEGLPLVAMMIAVSIQPLVDAVLLSQLAPADAVGWYGAAKNIMGTLLAPALILGSAWYPRLSRVGHDPDAFRRELRSAVIPLLWLGALGGVGTFAFADVAIGLIYGLRDFSPAATILRVYGIGLFLLYIDVLLGHIITAAGRSTGFAIGKIASVLVGVGLEIWLIPLFQERYGNGGIGVVVAFSASELVVFAASLFLMPRGSLEPRLLLDVARAVGAGVATALLLRILPPLSPFVGIPLCILAFTAFTLGLGMVRTSDLRLVVAALRNRR